MRALTLLLALVLAIPSPAQEAAPLVQPVDVPGKFAVTPQPFPALEDIVLRPVADGPVYGLYIWKSEYLALREQIRAVGWRHFRFGGPWDDEIMRGVVEDEVEAMLTLGGKKRDAFASDAEFIAAFVSAAEQLLGRYGPGGSFFVDHPELPVRPVTAVEIWNEPNFQYMIPDREPRAEVEREREALYAQLLPAAYAAIKARWPAVRVVGFGAGGASAGDLRFFANLWKLDAERISKSFDILSTHPYVHPAPPEADSVRAWGSYSVAKCLAAIRGTVGSAVRPVWYTEVGWPVSQADGGHFKTKVGETQVSPLLQAAYVCRMYALALRLGVDRVHIMFATDTDNFNAGFFLRDKSWRPSARAVQTLIRTLPCPKLVGAPNDGADGWYAWTFTADVRAQGAVVPPVTMAFSVAGPKRVELPWPVPAATVVDMLGASRRIDAVPATGGAWTVSVELGPYPVYLTPATP